MGHAVYSYIIYWYRTESFLRFLSCSSGLVRIQHLFCYRNRYCGVWLCYRVSAPYLTAPLVYFSMSFHSSAFDTTVSH
jgi:hypothetical protein